MDIIYEKKSNKENVIETAKIRLKDLEIIDNNIESKALQRKVFKKCKEAILRSGDFSEIGKYLVESLNNIKYEWSAFVYQKVSADYLISNFVYKIQLGFGDLYIVLISHYRQSDLSHNLSIGASSPSPQIQELVSSEDTHHTNESTSTIRDSDRDPILESPLIPHQLATVTSGHYLEEHTVPEVQQSQRWEWPIDRLIQRIKPYLSISSFK